MTSDHGPQPATRRSGSVADRDHRQNVHDAPKSAKVNTPLQREPDPADRAVTVAEQHALTGPRDHGSPESSAQPIRVMLIPARPNDVWPLRSDYVELVWSEMLGPSSTLLARRLGLLLDNSPLGCELDVVGWAQSLGIRPGKVRSSLQRLGRFGLARVLLDRGSLGVSGFAPSVPDERLRRLSPDGRQAHEMEINRREQAQRRDGQ